MIEHVAIIMDGNGRWAQKRGHPRVWGHIRGSSKVSDIVETANSIGTIRSLTLYAFSTENWNRPSREVKTLFFLLQKYIQKERKRIIRNQICFKVIGQIKQLPNSTQKMIRELEQETATFPGLKLNFAFDYGGRAEIISAINKFIENNPGRPITENDLAQNLFTAPAQVENIDLLIRTGGDQRISNFLLWQLAYAELYFTNTFWPDFSTEEFKQIYNQVSLRKRRFGGIDENIDLKTGLMRAKASKNELANKTVNELNLENYQHKILEQALFE